MPGRAHRLASVATDSTRGLMPPSAPPQSNRTGRHGEAREVRYCRFDGRFAGASVRQGSLGVRRRWRQFHPEGRALAGLGIEADPALHLLDEAACDVQAKAGTAFFARGRRVGLRKSFKYARAKILRDAGPGVAHADARAITRSFCTDVHRTRSRRIFHGVRQQIAEDLHEAIGIDVRVYFRVDGREHDTDLVLACITVV